MTNDPKTRTFVRLLRYRERHTLLSNDFIAPIARPSRRLTSASHDVDRCNTLPTFSPATDRKSTAASKMSPNAWIIALIKETRNPSGSDSSLYVSRELVRVSIISASMTASLAKSKVQISDLHIAKKRPTTRSSYHMTHSPIQASAQVRWSGQVRYGSTCRVGTSPRSPFHPTPSAYTGRPPGPPPGPLIIQSFI